MLKNKFIWIFAFILIALLHTAVATPFFTTTTYNGSPSADETLYNLSGGRIFRDLLLVTDIAASTNWSTKDTEPNCDITLNSTAGNFSCNTGGGGGGGENAVRMTTGIVSDSMCIDFTHELVTDFDGLTFALFLDSELDLSNDNSLALFYGAFGGSCQFQWCLTNDIFVTKISSGIAPAGTQNMTLCANGTATINGDGENQWGIVPPALSGTANATWYMQSGGATTGNEHMVVSRIFGYEASTGAPQSVAAETIDPAFNRSSINNSNPRINEVVALSLEVTDDTALANFRFADNRTGTFVNTTPTSISGTLFNATFNITVSLTRGNVIGFQWFVEDAVGNFNISEIDSFTVANTPPEIPTILFPTDGLITFNQPLDLNVTIPADADADTLTVSYYIDGLLNQTSTGNTTFNASDAQYILNVSLSDGFDSSSGNATVSFTVDTVNPILTVFAPTNNSLHRLDIAVDLQCDNINLQNLSYSFSNFTDIVQVEFNATNDVTQSILQLPVLVAGLGDGFYNFNITCIDNASLTAQQFLNLTLDQTPPEVTTVLNNNTPEIGFVIQFNGTFTDLNGISLAIIANNVTGVFLNVSNVTPSNVTPFIFIFNHTAVNGTIAHLFTGEDAIGNSIQSGLIIYNSTSPAVDTVPPTIDSTAISNATPQESDDIQINVTCTDAFTGLANIFVANNASGVLTNVSTFPYLNQSTVTLSFNHTVVLGSIDHQFTCADGVDNEAQSGFVNYNSTALPVVPAITAAVVFPLESASNLVGSVAMILIILGIFGVVIKRRSKK